MRRGSHHTPEARLKMSRAVRPPMPEEQKQKIAATLRGRKRPPMSAEWRKKIGDAHRGRKLSAVHRLKLSRIFKGRKRAPFSAEWRRNLGAAGRRYWVKRRQL